MPVNTCEYCGTIFPGRSTARFCNRDCYRKKIAEDAARRPQVRIDEPKPDSCDYNVGVQCFPVGDCRKCGWNPDVAQERSDRILAELLGREVETDAE